ncbi:Histone h1.3 [Penicillium atrosanguineum]|uniref:Histone h1.3 n=1 Tax=Penicillium atrosanguineum TaxID=1132637 RepID=A0A9W9HDV4_9EURO|nr:uncharacterized protein N7443_005880 [Penicillium atrosanguineum]KAJ5128763.1 Histone h1.3 [Penicillium atrosanguineum]KAJ5145087.1 Histone h1.3 [Penicillium atrosanguineum]KAJ5300878.1 hypothetical protein N7443_005880 [Penicillium atrosanguineum]KAJ5311522.1 Histone h1.3 [Penicillium atrosanguineum]
MVTQKASPAATGFMGLSESQNRLMLLATLCESTGHVDYEELATLAGITKASARTMYPKARKKLAAFHAATISAASANSTIGAAPDAPILAKKSAAPRRYKKRMAANETAADEDLPDTQYDADNAEPGEA